MGAAMVALFSGMGGDNVAYGYVATERMLEMFKSSKRVDAK
jgi:hypothetical protein